MGDEVLPPFSLAEVVTRWQFAPIITAFAVVAAGLYLWGVLRVRRRHPARPWPLYRTALFLGGLAIVVIATESGIGSYDDVLFWDHMVQHLLLLMVAPPLLVVGQPATLLLHASRNPLHTWAKRVLRSRVLAAITWPPFGVALYVGVIVGTHLTGFMNLVETNSAVHDAEHALYLISGYLYFLPLIGREPIRWKVSYPSRIFLLFIAMPVDAFTGLVLGSESRNPFPGLADNRPGWAPSPLSDVHIGGAVMWVGGCRHHVRPGDGGVLRLEPGKARRRRPRLARSRSPVQLRHRGRLAWGRERQRRARPGVCGISGRGPGAGPRPGDRRRRRAPGGLQRLPGPDQQARRTADRPSARHAGSAF